MLTIQILDSGETFFRTLERRPLTLGSSSDSDVQLREAGVAAEHARIEPVGEDPDLFKIVDLDSESGTLVNGEPVAQRRIQLGDRIEIGRAILVVGQRVRRPATAADVLENGFDKVTTRARAQRAPAEPKRSRKVVIGSVVAGVLACVAVAFFGSNDHTPPSYYADVARQCDAGNFEEAKRLIATLRARWVSGYPERAERVDRAEAEVKAIEQAFERGVEEIRSAATSRSRAHQLRDLRKRQKADPNGIDGRAAYLLLVRLDELRDGIVTVQHQVATTDDAPAKPEITQPEEAPKVATPETVERPGEYGNASLERRLARIQRICAAGDVTQALELIASDLETASEKAAVRLRRLRGQIHDEIASEVSELMARARSVAASGRREDLVNAIALLERSGRRFPAEHGETVIRAEAERMRGALSNSGKAGAEAVADAQGPDLIELRQLVDDAQEAESVGEFVTAGSLLRSLIGRVRSSDASYARHLEGRLADVELLHALELHLVAHAGSVGGSFDLELRDGGAVAVRVIDGRLRTENARNVPWGELAARPLAERLTGASEATDALLGLAVLAFRGGEPEAAEALLVPIAKQLSGDKRLVGVVARGRGDLVVDARGYKLVDGAFVAVRELESSAASEKFERRLEAALRRDHKARAAELEKIFAEGPEVLDAVVLALRRQLATRIATVENHSFKKTWRKVGEKRKELDERRAAALELIFDEKRYFYPYKPPAVSGLRASEYHKVQKEVDVLVRAVDKLWRDTANTRRVPGKLTKEVERIDWIVDVLRDFGESADDALTRIEWVRTLPRLGEGELTLQNFCWTVAERKALDESRRVQFFNRKKFARLTTAERAQVEITNRYRELLGRAPLAVNMKLVEATRGHADEMARLGYFSHFSPNPKRKTPFQRMQLAGYDFGISENIANHSSASSAHHGWTHSSGHHRNLLSATHSEFAVGNEGKYWVQNFGRGDEFLKDQDFPK